MTTWSQVDRPRDALAPCSWARRAGDRSYSGLRGLRSASRGALRLFDACHCSRARALQEAPGRPRTSFRAPARRVAYPEPKSVNGPLGAVGISASWSRGRPCGRRVFAAANFEGGVSGDAALRVAGLADKELPPKGELRDDVSRGLPKGVSCRHATRTVAECAAWQRNGPPSKIPVGSDQRSWGVSGPGGCFL